MTKLNLGWVKEWRAAALDPDTHLGAERWPTEDRIHKEEGYLLEHLVEVVLESRVEEFCGKLYVMVEINGEAQ